MNRFLAGSTALGSVLLIAAPSLAQVTPEDVWQNWQDAAASGGYTISGASTARAGDTLTIDGAVFTFDDGASGTIEIPVSPITLTDNGDGSVDVAYPEEVTFTSAPAPEGEVLTVTVSAPGAVTTASGTPDAVAYDTVIPQAGMGFVVQGGPSSADVTLGLSNATADSLYTTDGTGMAFEGGFAVDSLTVNGTFDDATAGNSGTITLSVANVSSASLGSLTDVTGAQDLAAALAEGTVIDFSTEFGALSLAVDGFEGQAGPGKVSFDATSGTVGLAMSEAGLDYTVGMNGAALAVSGADIPLPEVRVGLGEFLFDLSMPLVAAAEPVDFLFVTRLVDLTISDDLWALVDPAGQFPRGPASVVIDTSGQATVTTSLVDEAAMAALGAIPPGEINALSLNALQLAFGGAVIDGSGDLTFDNSDLETYGGMPAPTGTISLSATGVNTLIDTLVTMGFVPEDQAMGARMMLSMFANPADDGSDSLMSEIEFRDGGLFVNGQQLQ